MWQAVSHLEGNHAQQGWPSPAAEAAAAPGSGGTGPTAPLTAPRPEPLADGLPGTPPAVEGLLLPGGTPGARCCPTPAGTPVL